MKKIYLIFVAAWLFSMIDTTAFADSPGAYAERTTFKDCEFQVFFPAKTKQSDGLIKGKESSIVQNVFSKGNPFMKAECLPLPDPKKTIAKFRSILENQARNNGIQNPEIGILKSKLGVVGTYAGLRKTDGIDFKFFGKLVIGNVSIISLLISEEVAKYPSDSVVFFLNSVEKKER